MVREDVCKKHFSAVSKWQWVNHQLTVTNSPILIDITCILTPFTVCIIFVMSLKFSVISKNLIIIAMFVCRSNKCLVFQLSTSPVAYLLQSMLVLKQWFQPSKVFYINVGLLFTWLLAFTFIRITSVKEFVLPCSLESCSVLYNSPPTWGYTVPV